MRNHYNSGGMKLIIYRVSHPFSGLGVYGAEIFAGRRGVIRGSAKSFHVRVEGTPEEVLAFIRPAKWAIKNLTGQERRNYFVLLSDGWQMWKAGRNQSL